MDALKRAMALGLVGAMVSPSLAWAADYPRQITIEGMSCIEKIGSRGELETWCQSGEQMRLMSVDPNGPSGYEASAEFVRAARLPDLESRWSVRDAPPPNDRFSLANYQLRSPYASAQVAAQQNAHGGRYFAGGFVSGFFLGPIGWLVAGLTANNSDVYLPPSLPSDWTSSDQSHFMYTYTNEVRSKRTTNALLGGVVGTLTSVILVYSIVAASK